MESQPVREIDFMSPIIKKQRIDDTSNPLANTLSSSLSVPSLNIKPPDEHELESLFKNLQSCDSKPVVLLLLPAYSSSYVPKTQLSSFPMPLQLLFQAKYLDMSYNELLSACEKVTLCVTDEMVSSVEEATRNQSSS